MASSYGTKLTEYFIHFAKQFTDKDNPVPMVLSYQTGDNDYSAQLTKLKVKADKLGIQAIILPTWPQDAPTIAKQARNLGIDLPLIGTDGVDTTAVIDVGGQAVEGMIFSTHFHPDQPNLPEMAKKFVAAYQEKHDDVPGAFGTMGYEALMVMAEAVGRVIQEQGSGAWDAMSLDAKRVAVRDALLNIRFQWTTQSFSYTPEGWPRKGQIWKAVKNGDRVFHHFQPYASFTPAGMETMPFK